MWGRCIAVLVLDAVVVYVILNRLRVMFPAKNNMTLFSVDEQGMIMRKDGSDRDLTPRHFRAIKKTMRGLSNNPNCRIKF